MKIFKFILRLMLLLIALSCGNSKKNNNNTPNNEAKNTVTQKGNDSSDKKDKEKTRLETKKIDLKMLKTFYNDLYNDSALVNPKYKKNHFLILGYKCSKIAIKNKLNLSQKELISISLAISELLPNNQKSFDKFLIIYKRLNNNK